MSRLLQKYLNFAIKRPLFVTAIVVGIAALTAFWLVAFKPLKLDTNFTSLLPDDLPCVIESRRISKLVGSTDYLYVAVDSPVVQDNEAFVDSMAEKLKSLPEIEWISIIQDKSYFRKRRLLYLDTVDLQEVVKRAKARLDFEKKIQNPFYVSLDDEKPPDISLDDIMDKYRKRFEKRGASGLLDKAPASSQKDKKTDVTLVDRYQAKGGRIMSLVARPSKPALNMDFGRELVAKAEKLVAENNPHRNPQMKVEVVGPYRNRVREYESVVGDIFSSLAVALGLILLIIICYFRRLRTLVLIFVPLVIGTLFTVGLTALALGRLNMTTALIFAVILGLGIDVGVHMSVRYLEERARGQNLEASLRLALFHTGRAILTAGLTTAGGLAVLLLAEFKGFTEFGIIATMGVVTCLIVYAVTLPALATLMEKISKPKPWRKRRGAEISHGNAPQKMAWYLIPSAVLIAATTLAGFSLIPRVEFEYNFRNLRGKKTKPTIDYGKTLGQGSSPVVAVLPTPEDARVLTRHLERIIDEDTENKNLVKRVYSAFSFIPEDQETRLGLLSELKGYLDQALSLKKLKEKTRHRLEEIRSWTEVGPVRFEELPDWVKGKFKEKDGAVGRMVYIYPRINEWKILEMEKFYAEYGVIDIPGKAPVRPSASGFILLEVVRAVQRDGWLMTIASVSVVFVLLLVDLRSFSKAVVVFIPLLVGASWTIAIMALFEIRIGIYNMLILPTMLGIGVDASVHLYHSYQEHGPGSLRYVLRTTGSAIVVAAMTTAVGFTGMLIVSHAGLRTIGILALVGIGTTLTGALVTQPLMLAIREQLTQNK